VHPTLILPRDRLMRTHPVRQKLVAMAITKNVLLVSVAASKCCGLADCVSNEINTIALTIWS